MSNNYGACEEGFDQVMNHSSDGGRHHHINENNDSISNYSNVESIGSTSYSTVATAAKHKLNDCFKHLRRHHWSHRRRNHQNNQNNNVEMGLLKRWGEACVAFIRKQSSTQPSLLNQSEKIGTKASRYKTSKINKLKRFKKPNKRKHRRNNNKLKKRSKSSNLILDDQDNQSLNDINENLDGRSFYLLKNLNLNEFF